MNNLNFTNLISLPSSQCWLKSTCKKYNDKNIPDIACPCRLDSDTYCVKFTAINTMYTRAFIPEKYKDDITIFYTTDDKTNLIFDELSKLNSKQIVDFVSSGKNLYLHSTYPGTGKTSWAIKLLKTYMLHTFPDFADTKGNNYAGCPALYLLVPRYFTEIKDNLNVSNPKLDFIKESLTKAELVIWDDIASKNYTEFERETLFGIIDYRLSNKKSNIFTSNLADDELRDSIGSRLYSRIIGESICYEFNAPDGRICFKDE